MSKRKGIDALNDDTQASAKRAQNPTGFRVARRPAPRSDERSIVASSTGASPSSMSTESRITTHPTGFRVARPPVQQSAERSRAASSTAAGSSSASTSSRITTLVLGPNGRLASKRKDRSHLTAQSTPSTSPPTEAGTTPIHADTTPAPVVRAEAPAANVPSSATETPDQAFQPSFIDIQTEPKPKRKKDNTTRVCDSIPTIISEYNGYSTSKSKLLEWLSLRDATLDEVLRHDGLGDYLGQPRCFACNIEPGIFKCKDCSGGGRLRCQTCVVKAHQDIPLHRIEVSHFVNIIENVKTDVASLCSDGLASFSTRIPSKILASAYNLGMGDAPARVHPLDPQYLSFSIRPASMP